MPAIDYIPYTTCTALEKHGAYTITSTCTYALRLCRRRNGRNVYIPRLRVLVERKLVDKAIVPCIKDFGYEKPKEFQIDVVREFVCGRDVFASVPTGSGKSICYACTPLVFDKLREHDNSGTSGHCITAIVSPLTALMQDQTAKFESRGLKVAYLGGEEDKIDSVMDDNLQLFYFSHECILSHSHVCLSVDEAR